jgi:ATP-binding cassette, subfamily C (CFTR/MRP), member 2
MSNGEIVRAAPFNELIASCKEFQNLVHAHEVTVSRERLSHMFSQNDGSANTKSDKIRKTSCGTITQVSVRKENAQSEGLFDQLIKKEERASGDTGLKPYMQYLGQNKGYLFFSLGAFSHLVFVSGQILQNSWMAANLQNPNVSTLKLILVYLGIGFGALIFLVFRSLSVVVLGLETSKSLFSQLLGSLFRAPMGFYNSTPLGRILSRVSKTIYFNSEHQWM